MRKAKPKPMRPSPLPGQETHEQVKEPWEHEIDNLDRQIRYSNYKFKTRCVRLDLKTTALIGSDRRIPLERLNKLEPVAKPSDEELEEAKQRGDGGERSDSPVPAQAA